MNTLLDILSTMNIDVISTLSLESMPGDTESGFTQFIKDYGPWAMIALLFASGVGIPIGEEVVNIPAGIFVGRGDLAITSTYIAAYVGVLGGDFLWFSICRTLGKKVLHRRWFKKLAHPKKLLQVKHQFDRRGAGVLVLARFIPGTRSPALTVAGILHMPWKKFTIIEVFMCLVTTSLQVTLGILIGRQIAGESLSTTIFTALGVVAGIIALTSIVSWIVSGRRNSGPKPREKMAWLRAISKERSNKPIG